jgi:uncharacterized protein (DUF2235 family)
MTDHKHVALFLDGTWNTVNDNTNVWRLKSLYDSGPDQKVYYSAGVGTAKGEKFTGGLFGFGIDEEVLNAYEWLVENFEEGSRIFIFGFSRGAFTARSLAGFIAKCGLLKPGSPLSLKQLYERYRAGNAPSILALQNNPPNMTREEQWLLKYSRKQPVYFQGVWDTVGELGVPLPYLPHVSTSSFAFLETDLRINESFAYHAMAVDEHREAFKPTLWKYPGTPSFAPRTLAQVEQRWFTGAHANVGGGYDDDLLPQTPLKWIMERAQAHGLRFRDSVVLDAGSTSCPVHDSLKEMAYGVYAAFHQPYYRPISVTTGSATINETIDVSVFDRWRADETYRPTNVGDWAARVKLDPATVKDHVLAVDGSPLGVIPTEPTALSGTSSEK